MWGLKLESYIQILTTTEKKEDAEAIAYALVEKRLTACVQILGPITSIYHWKGKIEKSTEWQCLIKSNKKLFSEIEKTIKSIHPYEVPEIVAFSIEHGSENYMKWLEAEIKT